MVLICNVIDYNQFYCPERSNTLVNVYYWFRENWLEYQVSSWTEIAKKIYIGNKIGWQESHFTIFENKLLKIFQRIMKNVMNCVILTFGEYRWIILFLTKHDGNVLLT